jgi:predicted Zn-dependent protease
MIGYGFTQEYVDTLSEICKRTYLVGKLEDAETLAFQLRLVDPMNVEHYKLSGLIQSKMGRYDRAFNCYKMGLLIAPEDMMLWLALAQSSIQMERMNDAIPYLDRVLEKASSNSETYQTARRLRNLIQ